MYARMCICKDSTAPAHARTRAHRPVARGAGAIYIYIYYILDTDAVLPRAALNWPYFFVDIYSSVPVLFLCFDCDY